MATSPVGSPRAEAPWAGSPPTSSEATAPRRHSAHAGPPLPTRNAVPAPPSLRGKLPAGRSAAPNPTVKTLQELERQFDNLLLRPVESAGAVSQHDATRALIGLALRIAKERTSLPRAEAIRAIPDMKFVRIMATAMLRKEEAEKAAIEAHNAAAGPVREQIAREKAEYLKYADKQVSSAGKAQYFALVARVDRAGRVAELTKELIRLNQSLQQHHKEQIVLCEAAMTVHWTLDGQELRAFEDALMTSRLYQFNALSGQIHERCRLLLWAGVNPHPHVFAGLEIEELLPFVEKLTTWNALEMIAERLRTSPEPEPDLVLAEEREAIDGIRIAAADCAAYMATLADKVDAGADVIFTGESDRSIRDQAIRHLRDLEDTGWELADMARALLQPTHRQAAAASSQEKRAIPAKPRAGPKAKGKKHSAPRVQRHPAVQVPATQTAGRGQEARAARPPEAAMPPLAVEPPPQPPSAGEVGTWVSQLAKLLEQDPRPAHREEFQQLRKMAAPEKVVASRLHHAKALQTWANNLLAGQEKLSAPHLHRLPADQLRHAVSLKNRAATLAAQLQGEAQALTRGIDQFRLDLMKTYVLPEQRHWDQLLDRGQAHAVQLPRALPTHLSPPNTLFEVELRPTPLTGQDQPPPSVWLHLHTYRSADAATLETLESTAFAAMHLKSDVERRRGRTWMARQAALGLPQERIHRGQVDKRFVDKVIGLARKTHGAPGVPPG